MKNKLNELQNIIQNTTKNFSKNSHTKLNEEKNHGNKSNNISLSSVKQQSSSNKEQSFNNKNNNSVNKQSNVVNQYNHNNLILSKMNFLMEKKYIQEIKLLKDKLTTITPLHNEIKQLKQSLMELNHQKEQVVLSYNTEIKNYKELLQQEVYKLNQKNDQISELLLLKQEHMNINQQHKQYIKQLEQQKAELVQQIDQYENNQQNMNHYQLKIVQLEQQIDHIQQRHNIKQYKQIIEIEHDLFHQKNQEQELKIITGKAKVTAFK